MCQREEGWKNGIIPTWVRHRNWVHGAFKLDHLQPVMPILFPKFSNFYIFILGSPIIITPERGRLKMKFSQPEHSNWTLCCLFSQFCSLNFPTSTSLYWGVGSPILIAPERERLKMGKQNSPNLSETQGFECLGHSNWTIFRLLSQFCFLKFPTSRSLYWGAQFLLP